jgi:glycosyltransferase involved in cell wall biosynthesis
MAIDTSSQEALVSVLIPTYNRPAYLKEAIESAVQQSYQNIEIIVADDCSPESPQEIIDAFQDPRIIFKRNVTNLGMICNIRNMFKEARGKYIAHLNDDDLWNKDFLEKLVPPLEVNPDLVLAFCDHYMIDEGGAIDYPETEKCTRVNHRKHLQEGVYQPFCKLALVERAVAPACAAIIRKDVLDWDDIPSEAAGLWDVYINYLCCRSGHGAYYYPERLTRYRMHLQSYTYSYSKKNVETNIRKIKGEIFTYERLMEDERLEELKPYFKERWAHNTTSIGINLLRAKKAADARPYLLRALGQHISLRTLVALFLSFTPQSLASRF